jgi:ceramide glucosyltransferase
VTILKPLHGAEPQLAANLATFLEQDYPAPVQWLFGVQRGDDPAIAVIDTLRHAWPSSDIALVLDPRAHGTNGKVCNLINLHEHAQHDVVVISDSDMVVDPDYLARIVAALDQPGIGAVSCLYRGRADAGIWSALVAMGIDLHFLPSTLIGLGTGLAEPCMGSTIAMRTTTLAQIGGFRAVCDILADDYAIGEAVRAQGLKVAVSRRLITHACAEPSLAALVRHELRWSATIAEINPAGFAGSVVLHPLPFALAALAILGGHPWTWAAVVLAIGVRAAMLARLGGRPLARLVLIPVRDMLSFGLFLATFFVRSVDWRGHRLTIDQGRIAAASETLA